MFKIESYIANIILANADRYIKNFKKKDAQVSLWEGDATFHNIELNVDALNEEFQLPVKFASGYIHDLVIHVPWTKLNSEPVTVYINTIECVVKLKSKDRWKDDNKSQFDVKSRHHDQQSGNRGNSPPTSSYISNLTNRILNNVSIKCKNFILKLVEEDIVLSMNIEKLTFTNVNENWERAFAEMSMQYPLNRKLIDLSGVTICLDKQNSSGRIETYLEPLLYRCQITIRICRNYATIMSKNPSFSNINIFSEKMSFTLTEPQMPMLLRLLTLIVAEEQTDAFKESSNFDENQSSTSISYSSMASGAEEELSWSYWLWSMMPSLLPQEEEEEDGLKKNFEMKTIATLNVGFYIEELEIIFKFPAIQMKNNCRADYIPIMRGVFTGCLLQIISKNREWLNVQLGASSVNIHPVLQNSKISTEELEKNSFIISGNPGLKTYLNDSLFDDLKAKQFSTEASYKKAYPENSPEIDLPDQEDSINFIEVNKKISSSLDEHLIIFSESALLDRTPAFCIDYLKYSGTKKLINSDSALDNEDENDNSNGGRNKFGSANLVQKHEILKRFVFGSATVRITHSILHRLMMVYKLMENCDYFSAVTEQQQIINNHSSAGAAEKFPNCVTQYTFFDIVVEIHPTVSNDFSPLSNLPETFCAMCSIERCLCLKISMKYFDIKVVQFSSPCIISGRTVLQPVQKTISYKLVNVNGSIVFVKNNDEELHPLFYVEGIECDYSIYNVIYYNILEEIQLQICNLKLTTSKPNILLCYYTLKSYMDSLYQDGSLNSSKSSEMFDSSLFEDAISEPGKVFIEAKFGNISAKYKSKIPVKSVKVSIEDCAIYINKATGNTILSSPIMMSDIKKLDSLPCFRIMIQTGSDMNPLETTFPDCFYIKMNGISLNIDPLICVFVLYTPRQQNILQRAGQRVTAEHTQRNASNRKVSNSSNSSYSRRIRLNLSSLPKPKESVHSSMDQEVFSPLPADNVTDSFDYYTTQSLPDTALSAINPDSFSINKWVLKLYEKWKCSIIFGELSHLDIYIPICSIAVNISSRQDNNIRSFMTDYLKKKTDTACGALVSTIKSIRLKCDVPSYVLEDLFVVIPVFIPNNVWSPEKSSFPWALEITDFCCNTFNGRIDTSVLKSFSANCTISFSLRECENFKSSSVALYIHLDIQPVRICLNSTQVNLILSIADNFKTTIEKIYSDDGGIAELSKTNIGEEINVSSQSFNIKMEKTGSKMDHEKMAGWLQCTVTKLSFVLYHGLDIENEKSKLIFEIEDSILSLECDSVFHKIKVKIAEFSLQHYCWNFKNSAWIKGPYSGIIIKRRASEIDNRGGSVSEENLDRFLLATITRARYSNLQSKIFTSNPSSNISATNFDPYISEVILNICPMDVILPMILLNKFITIILPLMRYYKKIPHEETTHTNSTDLTLLSSKPFIYIDTRNLRLFIPTSNMNNKREIVHCDTILFEISSIHLDCQPENPIFRKRIQTNLYSSSAANKRISAIQFPEIEDRQYQLQLRDISVSSGIWSEFENMIIEEQIFPVTLLPGILQENPAVMWNQGHRLEDPSKICLKYISSITKFSCNILLAPAVICQITKTVICNASYEVSIASNISIQLSVSQLVLAVDICRDFSDFYLTYQKGCISGETVSAKKSAIFSTFPNKYHAVVHSVHSSVIDSGIESAERSSADSVSSSARKLTGVKIHSRVPNVHSLSYQRSANLKNIPDDTFESEPLNNIISNRICTSTTAEVFFTVSNISVVFYNVSKSHNNSNGVDNLVFTGILFLRLSQPHLLLNIMDITRCLEISFFHAKLKLPICGDGSANIISKIPSENYFKLLFLESKKSICNKFTGIPNSCFTINMTYGNTTKTPKVNFKLEQPIYVFINPKILNYLTDSADLIFDHFKMDVTNYSSGYVDGHDKNSELIYEISPSKYTDKFRKFGSLISEMSFSTENLIIIFGSDVIDQGCVICSNRNIRAVLSTNSKPDDIYPELITMQCSFDSLTIAALQANEKIDFFNEATISNINLSTNTALKPLNMNLKIVLNWNKKLRIGNCVTSCVTINTTNIIFDLTPSYLNCVSDIWNQFKNWSYGHSTREDSINNLMSSSSDNVETCSSENYKDDLRAGAFQYVKIKNYVGGQLPSAYEVIFCNRIGNPFVCWMYPHPRTITKLQIYPLLSSNNEENIVESDIECELQYFDEMIQKFVRYSKLFLLPKDTVSNITLPISRPDLQVSTCWRIELHCPVFDVNGILYNCIDVSLLAGCIWIDSLFQPSLIPNNQISLEISSIQVNFSTLCNIDKVPLIFDGYKICNIPTEYNVIVIKSEKLVASMLHRDNEIISKMCTTALSVNVMDYKYLMLRPFIDSFPALLVIHQIFGVSPELFAMIGQVNARFSQNIAHSLSISHWLWNNCNKTSIFPFKVAVPYIICNHTNCVIAISQESTIEEVFVEPGWCYHYAWFTPFAPKALKLIVFCDGWKLKSMPMAVEDVGDITVSCISEDGVKCILNITVTKISPVVHQVVIKGHYNIYNVTDTEMEVINLATAPPLRGNKKSDTLEHRMSSIITIAAKTLSSIIIPLNYDLCIKIRRKCSTDGDSDITHWSGIIPIKIVSATNGYKSWLVKVPLKSRKEHFQSIWCDVMQEMSSNVPRILIIFKPLCILQSYLPWNTYLKVLDEKGTTVSNITIGDKGGVQDLFIPDTISLDNFCIQWHQREEIQNTVSLTLVKPFSKSDPAYPVPSIDEIFKQIQLLKQPTKWPFCDDDDMLQLKWTANNKCNITPHFKILHKQKIGIGLSIEIYPSTMIINTFGCHIYLNMCGELYCIEHYSIFTPPNIQDNFELKLSNKSSYYSSGLLRLLNNDKKVGSISKGITGIPHNGFISTMFDCDEYVSFMNIKSKIVNDMKILNFSPSYVISNCSSFVVKFAAFAICNVSLKSSFRIPDNIVDISENIVADNNQRFACSQTIIKWNKIGNANTQILPYLIFIINGYISCPVRICDLSEKQAIPLLFSSSKNLSLIDYPSVSITAQHKEGQVFIIIWNERVQHITIHNHSDLSLSVLSSKTEKGTQLMYDCTDWNWKFHCASNTFAHYRIQNFYNSPSDKINSHYLVFAIHNENLVKDTKWSKGIQLQSCRNHLVTLPFSQRHIVVSIFRHGFTKIIYIESAAILSDTTIITSIEDQILRSHFIPGKGIENPQNIENLPNNDSAQDNFSIPNSIKQFYATEPAVSLHIKGCLEGFSITLIDERDDYLNNSDVATFSVDDVIISTQYEQCLDEVLEENHVRISVGNYQFDNDEYRYKTYDFPVSLINNPMSKLHPKYLYEYPSVDSILQIMKFNDENDQAMEIVVSMIISGSYKFNVRDIKIIFGPQCAYIEDKYMMRLKSLFELYVSSGFQNIMKVSIATGNFSPVNKPDSVPIRLNHSDTTAVIPGTVKNNNNSTLALKAFSSSSKSVNVSEPEILLDAVVDVKIDHTNTDESDKTASIDMTKILEYNLENFSNNETNSPPTINDEGLRENYFLIPKDVMLLSKSVANPLRLRRFFISSINLTVSVHTSTSFYIALDHSPVKFSEFSQEFLVTSPYQLGHLLTIHYIMGAIYGSGWAISNLEFVGCPGGLVRTVGTGIKDFVSLPIYGISNGPQGFVLGIASGSTSLMKHLMAGTLTSVTQFASSWARTLDRLTLHPDDLIHSEVTRTRPPTNITEGIVQGLTEFGISLLGAASGIAHHPLQYAVSDTPDRSFLNSISLGLVGMITRPLSGAAELVARTGQGILSHVGWKALPQVRQPISNNKMILFNTSLRYRWKITNIPYKENILFIIDGATDSAAGRIELITLILTNYSLYINEVETDILKHKISLADFNFYNCKNDHTLINAVEIVQNYKDPEKYTEIRIQKFIQETNDSLGILNHHYLHSEDLIPKISYKFYINPEIRDFFLTMINFIKFNTE